MHSNRDIGKVVKTAMTCTAGLQIANQMPSRTELLDECAQILSQRGAIYGSSRSNHERISELWSAYYGSYISPMQVSLMQLLVKVSRLSETPNHKDSVKDIIGYAAIYSELHDQYENDFGVDDGI